MTILLLSLIVFLATFTQSLTGFGVSLVGIPLLAALFGLQAAVPLMALIALTLEGILLLIYRDALNIQAVKRLTLASLVGIPIGVWVLGNVNEVIVLTALGVIITGYAIYALFTPRLPELHHPGWEIGLGFFSGILGGAYNTGGPPVIVYGTFRRWEPDEFKGNLQGFFVVTSAIVVITHLIAQNMTPATWQHFAMTLPTLALGTTAGLTAGRFIAPERFRKLVLALLVVIGLTLIF